ncbi:MAG: hypothetical protein COU66_03725 [Candidatus Pacebacteria bacterium CG10_big_fil_rev_8_21_14_0_10_44_11]|nr:MAG: hypothetical protein COU66_03725 [Candidatus Pacebacteria bacterium CG10_big_fil_rev_8_21_14_0_10_44_11]
MFNRSLKITFGFYLIVLFLFSVFSYALTDPNLVLSSWAPYWQFQTWMWQIFFLNHLALSVSYLGLMIGAVIVYGLLLLQINRSNQAQFPVTRSQLVGFLLVVSVLCLSYNALSHDVFNYIFNAKLIAVYHQNPHQVTALAHPADDWTRFMHNTHTPAPYGYGWTAVSLVPFFFGFGKFVLTWLSFRLMAIGSLLLLFLVLNKLHQQLYNQPLSFLNAAILFLNPLVLIEVVSSMHNDLWMMVPAMFALLLALKVKRTAQGQWLTYTTILLLFAFSILIKFATLLLLLIIFWLVAERLVLGSLLRKWLRVPMQSKVTSLIIRLVESIWQRQLPLICSLLMFLPLLTSRSQLFQPWYLLWSLSFLPLVKQAWWRLVLLSFSVSSLLRYFPWLHAGGFEGKVVVWQQVITWLVPVGLLLLIARIKLLHSLKQVLANTV